MNRGWPIKEFNQFEAYKMYKKKLILFGEKHFNDKLARDKQKEVFEKKAKAGHILLLLEGRSPKKNNHPNIKGIDHYLLTGLASIIVRHANIELNVAKLLKTVELSKIPKKIHEHKLPAKINFLYVIVEYMDKILSEMVRGNKYIKDETNYKTIRLNIGWFFTIFKNYIVGKRRKNAILSLLKNKKLSSEFVHRFLLIRPHLNKVLFGQANIWLKSIRQEFSDSEFLTDKQLACCFKKPDYHQVGPGASLYNKITITLRNQNFINNIFQILEQSKKADKSVSEIVFIVGNRHLQGLTELLQHDKRINIYGLDLKVDTLSESAEKTEENDKEILFNMSYRDRLFYHTELPHENKIAPDMVFTFD